MKKLIIINGTMGAGKTTVSRLLMKDLQPSVFLDGDWCWDMNPFIVNDENKSMVIDNITCLLKSFLRNTGYEYVIFCWVIHQEDIFRQILEPLGGCEFELYKVTLICSEEALKLRLQADVAAGIRQPDVIGRSVARIPLYERMDTFKVDVSGISPQQAAHNIAEIVKSGADNGEGL
ncbi:MAG TPA: AAA family ATPase [Caproiciproducens sp.]|nr:AAA family ATPase [Caproiciproducens sp.]